MVAHLVEEVEVLEEDNIQFIESEEKGIKGTINGLIGNYIFQIICYFAILIILTFLAKTINPTFTSQEISNTIDIWTENISIDMLALLNANIAVMLIFIVLFSFKVVSKLVKSTFSKKAFKYAIFGALTIIIFSFIYNYITVNLLNLVSDSNANQLGVEEMIVNQPVISFIIVCIAAPLIEELTYRYSLFGSIYKNNKKLAYIASAILFMGLHSVSSFVMAASEGSSINIIEELITLPPYAFSGIVLAYIYAKSKLLGSAIGAHFINNFISYSLIILVFFIG